MRRWKFILPVSLTAVLLAGSMSALAATLVDVPQDERFAAVFGVLKTTDKLETVTHIEGVVTAVNGNSVTLSLIEKSERPAPPDIDGGKLPDGTIRGKNGKLPEFNRDGMPEIDRDKLPELPRELARSITDKDGKTHEIKFIRDDDGTCHIYLDGQEVDKSALTELGLDHGKDGKGGRAHFKGDPDAERTVRYTGETVTVTLPDDFLIRAGSDSLTASELEEGQILQILRDTSDDDNIVHAAVHGKAAAEAAA